MPPKPTLPATRWATGGLLFASLFLLGTCQEPRLVTPVPSASASRSTVVAAPAAIEAGIGSATITVTAREANGNPISGATVALAATGTGNTLTQPTGPTDATGVATGTLGSTVAGAKTISATISGVAVTQTATVTVTLGAVSASLSTVAAAPATIQAGSETATITVTARDANGNPIRGATVVLAATGSGNTLIQPTSPTNASGVATGTLRSTEAGPNVVSATIAGTAITQTATVTVTAAPSSAIFVGAGDIADCASSGDEATAALLDGIPGTVFTAGDNAYENGTAADFANCYEPSWGRHKARTRPTPGNHDYRTSAGSPYYAYFGDNAGPAGRGYFSYDLGAWHIISLNSNIDMAAGSAQEQWLRADLAANPKGCTLAYWHQARFSSGRDHGSDPAMQPLWQALYEAGADVVIVGHDHIYERFGRQTPDGTADALRGIREFVVGTGGKNHDGIATPVANSEVRNNTTFGVLKLTLRTASYEWQFIPIAGQTFTDSGSDSCH